jgi:hypothetical protein
MSAAGEEPAVSLQSRVSKLSTASRERIVAAAGVRAVNVSKPYILNPMPKDSRPLTL